MARGCPVIAADATALPEVVGDAGVLVDPDDAEALGPSHDRPSSPTTPDERELGGRRPGAGPRRSPGTAPRTRWPTPTARRSRHEPRSTRPRSLRLVVICPALRARRRADRRGDDEHRRPSSSRRGHRLHVVTVAALVPAPRHRARVGGRPRAPRGHRRGAASPGSTRSRPTSATSRPGRWPSAASRSWPAWPACSPGAGPTRCWPCRRRSRSAPPAGPSPGPTGSRSCSTSRTCSPTSRSSSGAITNPSVIAAASWLERTTYRHADAVTVLSDDLRDNVAAKIVGRAARRGGPDKVRVIPNFIDTELDPAGREGERLPAGVRPRRASGS